MCFYPCGNTIGCSSTCVNGTAHVFPGFNPGGGTDFDHDLAVLNLNTDVTNLLGIAPRRVGASPTLGATLYLVGFGCSSEGGTDYG